MYSLEQLGAIAALKQLKAKYFYLMDTKNWSQWRHCFASDMVLDVDITVPDHNGEVLKQPTIVGADKVVLAVSTLLKDMRTVHHGHTFEVHFESATSASGIWAMADIVESANGKLEGYGHYHEHYVQLGGQWLIQRSHLTRLRLDISGDFEQDAATAMAGLQG